MVVEPFFSILTASLNSGATIRNLLISMVEQTYGCLEHIVLDGGSCDQTLEILREYDKQYNLQWRSEPDSGIANALNKGLRLARGKYLLVLQADDRLEEATVLARVYSSLQGELHDIYSCPVMRDEGLNHKPVYRPIKILWWHHFKTIFPHQGAFVHRRVFERVGGFREELKIAFDYDFFYRALQAGASVRFDENPAAVMGGGGISSDRALLAYRLKEEAYVHTSNEKNRLWRAAQALFRTVYVPYKISVS